MAKTIGRPKIQFCPQGHDTLICGRTKAYGCLLCADQASERYLLKNRDKIRLSQKVYARLQRSKHYEAQKLRNLRYKTKYRALQIEKAGRQPSTICELCFEPAQTVWDHDHKTGKFRGWLCQRCNRVLGSVKDDKSLLQKMINYLGESYEANISSSQTSSI